MEDDKLVIPYGMTKTIEITPGKKNRPFLFHLSMVALIGLPLWVGILCLIFK